MDYILLGIGNPIRADDGIGCYIADEFSRKILQSKLKNKGSKTNAWKIINTGTMPENFTSVIRKENPEFVVMVDSAELGLSPGEFRIISKEKLEKMHLTTHAMPLSFVMSYIEEFCEKVILIGIQPKVLGNSEEISAELKAAAKKIISVLEKREFEKIPYL